MLEEKMQTIKSLVNSLQNFFCEDQEAKKQVYFEKLEQTLNLTIKVFQKYDKKITHVYEFYDLPSWRFLNMCCLCGRICPFECVFA